MKKIGLLFLLLLPILAHSEEDWTWWNVLHNWTPDKPSWKMWLTISPGRLGPNALPVPEVKKGLITPNKEIEFGGDFHFSKGDNAQDLFGRFYMPFIDNKVAIEIYGVMIEHYAMSEEIRDLRIARDKDGRGIAFGDLYFATMVQLIRNHQKLPNTMLRMACKTASGNRLDAARFADYPGYFIDLSFSKKYQLDLSKMQLLPYGSLGFYSWQTNDQNNLQDDALYYGLGLEATMRNWSFSNSWSGYYGYKNNGDQPMVYTLNIQRKIKNKTFRLQYLHGLHDWMYRTIKVSLILNWN